MDQHVGINNNLKKKQLLNRSWIRI